MLTLVPDLIAVWRIQAQLVADIGGAYGRTASLTQEQMLYCLFRHAAVQVARDLGVRVGERFIFRPATIRVIQAVAQRLGITVTQRLIAKSVARWLPVLGSLGVAAYAYYDTGQVAATAIELFESEAENGDEPRTNGTSGRRSELTRVDAGRIAGGAPKRRAWNGVVSKGRLNPKKEGRTGVGWADFEVFDGIGSLRATIKGSGKTFRALQRKQVDEIIHANRFVCRCSAGCLRWWVRSPRAARTRRTGLTTTAGTAQPGVPG